MRLLLVAVLSLFLSGAAFASDVMTADQARKAALAGEVTLVDIRTPQEWTASGVPDAAHLLDMKSEGFVQRLMALYQAHPDRPVAFICASGVRSAYVTRALTDRGLDRIVNVSEGMFGNDSGPGWMARGLPVRKPGDARVED